LPAPLQPRHHLPTKHAGHGLHAINVEHETHLQTGEPLHADVTALLLARGADPQRSGPDGTTPLHDAETAATGSPPNS
jgi:hypothetical protein